MGRLATTSLDNRAILWRLSDDGLSAKCVAILSHECDKHYNGVRSIAFHPNDQSYIFTGNCDGTVNMWHVLQKPNSSEMIASCQLTMSGNKDSQFSKVFVNNSGTILAVVNGSTTKLFQISLENPSVWTLVPVPVPNDRNPIRVVSHLFHSTYACFLSVHDKCLREAEVRVYQAEIREKRPPDFQTSSEAKRPRTE